MCEIPACGITLKGDRAHRFARPLALQMKLTARCGRRMAFSYFSPNAPKIAPQEGSLL
jgi:phosphoribulokinase